MNSESGQEPIECVEYPEFLKFHLRVGLIRGAESVPQSPKFLKLRVDCGADLGTRTVVSGLGLYYQPDELIDRRVVVVANVKPVLILEEQSEGIVLAACADDGSELKLLDPGQDLEPGTPIR